MSSGKSRKPALVFLLAVLLPAVVIAAGETGNGAQFQKERALVQMLKKLVTCKNMGVYEDADLYCSLSFRGLQMEFAGVNQKGGGNIYVTALGKNQTLSSWGSRCIQVGFGDEDLKGIIDAHILFRNDGVIAHTTENKKAWAECQ